MCFDFERLASYLGVAATLFKSQQRVPESNIASGLAIIVVSNG